MTFTIGSLFDGSGGFPLAASLAGGMPVWASEVEPYPIAVTRSRFPQMRHLGDISKINGAEIEPVDVITFGSPCQDLSVAGKRAGLKHEANGDDETTRSGLFMEAVRIIREMRDATNGRYPTYAVWENVPGAFSSNRGEDFRTVLEELIKIVEPCAVMPAVPQRGWPYADSYVGDGWSLAYRVFDAQYWGVPQRRRRIHLVVDFRGERAGKILFEREGVRGYFETGRTPWQGATANAERGVGTDDSKGTGCVACYDARGNGDGTVIPTLTGDHENSVTDYTAVVCGKHPSYCLQGNGIDRADTAGYNGKGWKEDQSYTLNTIDRPAVVYAMQAFGDYKDSDVGSGLKARDYKDATDLVVENAKCYRQGGFAEYIEGEIGTWRASGGDFGGGSENLICEKQIRYIVRRLTPTECARLQGFPDRWGEIDSKNEFTDEEYAFWLDVRNTLAAINGKKEKEYTKAQMLSWYNKLHTDSAEYKMWGNGIALPPALYVMQGIADTMERRETMADKIKAYCKRPGQVPRSVWVTNSLKNLQNYVGGYIEAVTCSTDCAIICNEEGRILDLPYNCNFYGIDLYGDILFVGVKGDEFADMPVSFAEFKTMCPSLWEV